MGAAGAKPTRQPEEECETTDQQLANPATDRARAGRHRDGPGVQ